MGYTSPPPPPKLAEELWTESQKMRPTEPKVWTDLPQADKSYWLALAEKAHQMMTPDEPAT